jgi:hypothetical protein
MCQAHEFTHTVRNGNGGIPWINSFVRPSMRGGCPFPERSGGPVDTMKHEVLSKDGTVILRLDQRKAIPHFCLGCCDFVRHRVVDCVSTDCILHPYRLGPRQGTRSSREARARVIIRYCTDCSGVNGVTRDQCDAKVCALFPHRNGNGAFTTAHPSPSESKHHSIMDHLRMLLKP